MNGLVWAILLTLAPLTELRLGLPIALMHAVKNSLPTFPIFILILLLNILLIFLIFFFLDYIHYRLLNIKFYNRISIRYLNSMQRKTHRFEKRYKSIGFLSLVLLVGMPVPFTGAYTGALLSWLLGLNRKKSVLAIGTGVIIAGIIIYLGALTTLSL